MVEPSILLVQLLFLLIPHSPPLLLLSRDDFEVIRAKKEDTGFSEKDMATVNTISGIYGRSI
jgi:hypothetical protein